MATCIPEQFIDDIEKIVDESPSSLVRLQKLTDLFGGNSNSAQDINLLFEKKLLLKNQTDVVDKFIDSINGLELEKKTKLKEDIARRMIDRTEQIQDDELLSIAKDIFDRKYDIDLKPEQVSIMNKLKKQAYDFGQLVDGTPDGSPERIAQASKVVELSEYLDSIINPEQSLGFTATVKDILKKTGQRFEGLSSYEKILEGGKITTEILTSAVYKSIQASMDFSFALRQGFKVLGTNPKAWFDNVAAAFKPFKEIMTPQQKWQALHSFKVNLVSRQLYKQALDSKLAIGVIEEFFPTTLSEKIPLFGNLFKASNEAFTIFSQGARMSLFEDMVSKATKNGVELTPELFKDFALVANSITGRGHLGDYEKISGNINKLFYSGRFIKSQLDTFYLPFKPGLSPEARKVAIRSSLQTLSMFAGLMATASLFTDVETDPRSSKFGKMKVPGSSDTWVDISGGLGSYITLASRVATQKSKSATTGKITKLNTGDYGARTSLDVVYDFLGNKLAPAPSVIKSYLKGKDFQGNKPTIASSVTGLVKPISAGNMVDIFENEEVGTAFLTTMFDLLGAGQTNYQNFR